MNNYLNKNQQKKLGILRIGKNCKISKYVRVYALNCSIGNNVRIDDDVVLKGKIKIESNVHIARGCTISGGKKGIILKEFSTLSNYCQMFTESDDYSNTAISGGTLNDKERKKFCKFYSKEIIVGKSAIIGPFSIILPGANIGDFSTVGPHTCLYKKIKSGFYVYNKALKKIVYKKRNISNLKNIYEKYFKNNR